MDNVIKDVIRERKCLLAFIMTQGERDSFGILYTGYLLSIVKVKKEIEREGGGERERER